MRALLRAKTVVISLSAMAMILACTAETAKQDTTNTFITVTGMRGLAGGADTADDLFSDVCSNDGAAFPPGCTAVEDLGEVTMRAQPKNLIPNFGAAFYNDVVFTRYRVTYVRSDGRNTAGVDVPYPFDGVMQFHLIPDGSDNSTTFTIVRHQAKLEPPLKNLAGNGGAVVLSTLAQVDFYGTDNAGRTITARGYLNITFGDF